MGNKKSSGAAAGAGCSSILLIVILIALLGSCFGPKDEKSIKDDDSVQLTVETKTETLPSTLSNSADNNSESAVTLPNDVSDITQDTTEAWEPDMPKLTADDLDVRTMPEYSHLDSETFVLGNDEGFTITVKTSVSGIISDDILIIYDNNLLSIEEKTPQISNGNAVFTYYVTGIVPCDAEIIIITAYDYLTKAEKAQIYSFNVKKLDQTEGRICYVTPTGEKYHLSEYCAGDNAIKTTYYDAVACEYEPCGKCS